MKCTFCDKESFLTLEESTHLVCPYHYVKYESDGCLMALLASNPSEEIIKEVKKQRPTLYEQFKSYLS